MKRLLAVLLAIALTSSLVVVSVGEHVLTADASEQEGELLTELVTPASEEVHEPEEPEEFLSLDTSYDASALPTAEQGAPSIEVLSEPEPEVPYWVADPTYQELIANYEALKQQGAGTNASMTVTSAPDGSIAATIMMGDKHVVSNGTNAPLFDDASGIHLTPREGLPQAGMTSDRSVLVLHESTDERTVYEASFYFGSLSYPEAPFTAMKTFVVFDAAKPQEATGSTEEANATTATLPQEEERPSKKPYAEYVNTFWDAYTAGNPTNYVTAAHFTVSEVLDNGTVKGMVGSQSIAILGTSGDAQALTESLPSVGETSTAALLTYNGSTYDALFLFGDTSAGASSGSAIGGFQVSLELGPTTEGTVATGEEVVSLSPSPVMARLGRSLSSVSTLSSFADSLYVGQSITGSFSGQYWYWNGVYYGAVFGMTLAWQGTLTPIYLSCIEPMVYGPESVSFHGSPVYGTITGIDRVAGLVYVNLWSTGHANYYQDLSGTAAIALTFTGDISLVKDSAAPDITSNNASFDLAGAQYGLYGSWDDAMNDRARIHTFTTNSSGNATSVATGLPNRTYYLRELVPPKGYALDTAVHEVQHTTAHTTIHRTDQPLGATPQTLVQKIDTTTGDAYGKDDPQGSLLAGAEFTVRYWDGYYDSVEEAEAAGSPLRTWIVETTIGGKAELADSMLKAGSDPLYRDLQGAVIVPLGTLTVQETAPPSGYLLPDPSPVSVQHIKETGDPLSPVTALNTVRVEEHPHEVVVEKLDSATGAPVSDTEFTLYKESSKGAGDWTEVMHHTTDTFGKCVFSPVAVGSYMLDETRPHPAYAEIEESGDGVHYFEITQDSTEEVQVFVNDLVQVAIDVYKKTIPLTNTALDGTKDQAANHVGQEAYLYHFGAKNLSNVRVDEFVVTDSLEYVTSKGYRMTTLWTGTAPVGMDYDGLMHILYKTNKTDPAEPVSFAYDPMQANPYNANNPHNHMSVSLESGWRVWQECVSTTSAIRLDVANLQLAEDEYIVGLRAVYGGVVKGFYTGKAWGGSPLSTADEEAGSLLAQGDSLDTLVPFELRDWSYEVVATGALLPINEMGSETVMEGSITADLFRNWGEDAPVLTDIAHDKVETRVITTFSHDTESLGITPGGFGGAYLGFPTTGDNLVLVAGALALLAVAVGLLVGAYVRRRI